MRSRSSSSASLVRCRFTSCERSRTRSSSSALTCRFSRSSSLALLLDARDCSPTQALSTSARPRPPAPTSAVAARGSSQPFSSPLEHPRAHQRDEHEGDHRHRALQPGAAVPAVRRPTGPGCPGSCRAATGPGPPRGRSRRPSSSRARANRCTGSAPKAYAAALATPTSARGRLPLAPARRAGSRAPPPRPAARRTTTTTREVRASIRHREARRLDRQDVAEQHAAGDALHERHDDEQDRSAAKQTQARGGRPGRPPRASSPAAVASPIERSSAVVGAQSRAQVDASRSTPTASSTRASDRHHRRDDGQDPRRDAGPSGPARLLGDPVRRVVAVVGRGRHQSSGSAARPRVWRPGVSMSDRRGTRAPEFHPVRRIGAGLLRRGGGSARTPGDAWP